MCVFLTILINAKKPQQMKNIIRLVFTACIQQQLLDFTCRTSVLHLEKFGYAAYLQKGFSDIPPSAFPRATYITSLFVHHRAEKNERALPSRMRG